MPHNTGNIGDPINGKTVLDTSGSVITAVKIDATRSYGAIPVLLKAFINEGDMASWQMIKRIIDEMHGAISQLLTGLDRETDFTRLARAEVGAGRQLLFKPNLVYPTCIDHITHGEGLGFVACTPWAFVAAVMRWFHDALGIPYFRMAVGEAATQTSVTAGYYTLEMEGKPITTEAVMEGKSGDFYGGWGFYFARKYLSESRDTGSEDDPMKGYEESVSGQFLAPGRAGRRLMVYDLNRIKPASRGRDIPVPDGANFKNITLHKAVIGGNPENLQDRQDYPGCFLVSLSRLKVHNYALFTGALKNLGIGLYPLEAPGDHEENSWKYAFPWTPVPGMKADLPHQTWVARSDNVTGLPLRNQQGKCEVERTTGLSGTIADVIRALQHQSVSMLHIVDAIETANIDHTGNGLAVPVREGYIFGALDPVALDLFCARYLFKTVPLKEARTLQKEHNLPTDFLQAVPVPRPEGQHIVSVPGFDTPVERYNMFGYAEKRGLGKCQYHVNGTELATGFTLASCNGHFGRVKDGIFSELITAALYYSAGKMLWDLQKTALGYFAANDILTGSSYYKELMSAFDENNDGIIDYDEMGRNGFLRPLMRVMAAGTSLRAVEKYGYLHWSFLFPLVRLKYAYPKWNKAGYDFTREFNLASIATVAFKMSRAEKEREDPLFPGMSWGRGNWPSAQYATYCAIGNAIYGAAFPDAINLNSSYGCAFQYADKLMNGGKYTGSPGPVSYPDALTRYLKDVSEGGEPLDFTFFIPEGYGSLPGQKVANVAETGNPGAVFSVTFSKGREIW